MIRFWNDETGMFPSLQCYSLFGKVNWCSGFRNFRLRKLNIKFSTFSPSIRLNIYYWFEKTIDHLGVLPRSRERGTEENQLHEKWGNYNADYVKTENTCDASPCRSPVGTIKQFAIRCSNYHRGKNAHFLCRRRQYRYNRISLCRFCPDIKVDIGCKLNCVCEIL